MSHKAQLTVRGLSPRVEREIRDLARRERISLNRAASRMLERAAGVPGEQPRETGSDNRIGGALDHLIGTWSDREAESFLKSIEPCEQIDPELWE
ncbi:MAG TPA: hypothetical protein VIU64_10700 [Polyangia bacterium]